MSRGFPPDINPFGHTLDIRGMRHPRPTHSFVSHPRPTHDTLFSPEQFNEALRKVDIAKGKRLNRLRDQTQKTLTDKDDMKKLLGIDKWCQNRMKALTNETAKLIVDGKKVMVTYKPCSLIISLTLTAVFGPSLHLVLICRMRRSGLCGRR